LDKPGACGSAGLRGTALPRHQADPGRELAPAVELSCVGHRANVSVVLLDALVQVVYFAEQVADDGVGVAGQVFELVARLAPHHSGLERQHDAEFAEQAADAVDGGRARLHIALPRPMHHQTGLLLFGLDRHEAHVGALYGFAVGCRISSIVLALLAAHAVGRNELGAISLSVWPLGLELPRPVVGAGACFDAIMHGGSAAISALSLARATLGWRN